MSGVQVGSWGLQRRGSSLGAICSSPEASSLSTLGVHLWQAGLVPPLSSPEPPECTCSPGYLWSPGPRGAAWPSRVLPFSVAQLLSQEEHPDVEEGDGVAPEASLDFWASELPRTLKHTGGWALALRGLWGAA